MAGDNEPRLRVASSHSDADFDLRAGSPRSPHGEAPNDGAEHEVANAREPEQTRSGNGARQRGLDSFLSGTASNQEWSAGAAGRGKRKREAETGKPFNYQGKKLTIYKRRHPHAAEDKR